MIRVVSALACLTLLAACATLQPPSDEVQGIYVLEASPAPGPASTRVDIVLGVSAVRSRPGFDTPRMAFQRRPHEIEYFARNFWVDTPGRMLAPLVARSLEQSGSFRGVVQLPHAAAIDRRVDIELVRLLQDFSTKPSRVRLTLRAQLIDTATRRIVATRELDDAEDAPTDDPYGGVIAANRVLRRILGRLTELCAQQFSGLEPGSI